MIGVLKGLIAIAVTGVSQASWSLFAFQITTKVIAIFFLGATTLAIHRKAKIGRWLCMVVVGFLLVVIIYRLFAFAKPVTSSAEATGQLAAIALVIYWFYAVGFSSKSRAFFVNPSWLTESNKQY